MKPTERASKLTCYIIIVRFLDSKRRKIALKRTMLCAHNMDYLRVGGGVGGGLQELKLHGK